MAIGIPKGEEAFIEPLSGGGPADEPDLIGQVASWMGFSKTRLFDATVETLRFGAPVDVTIASNAITITSSNHNITASGTLNTINAWDSSGMMVLLTADAAVTIAHGADNILCWGDQNITVDVGDLAILFRPDPTSTNYVAMGDTFSASSHTRSHTVTNTSDHTSAATSGQMLKADANGLPVDATNTDTEVASAVTNLNYYNGTFLESFRLAVTSNGSTILGTLDANPSGDLTQRFSDGNTTYSSSTVNITAGSATSPAKRYIYILQSDKATLAEGAAWPATEHIKVAEVVVQTAALVQSDGVLANRNWNDHAQGGSNDTPPSQGHHTHAWERLRWEHAAYVSGGALTWAGSGTGALDFDITATVVLQMHPHTTDTFDTTTPAEFLVVNQHADNGGAYDASADIDALVNDSEDGSLTNRYYNIVIWGSVSSGSEQERMFVNLPGGSYNKASDAIADVLGFDVFAIPTDFRGYAYLIQRTTIRNQTDSTFTIVKEADLRGTVPSIQAGGGTAAITTEFADNAFKLFDEGNPTREIAFQASGISASTTRTITMPDEDVTLHTGTHAVNQGGTNLTALPKRSIMLTAAGGAPSTTTGCSDPTKVEAGTNDVDYWVLDFATGSDEYAFWNVVMPDNYDGGTVTAIFYWTAASGSGTVNFLLAARAYADSDPIDAAWTDVGESATDTLLTAGDVHISPTTSAITINGGPAAGEYVVFRVVRDVSADNLGVDARLMGIKVLYTTDSWTDA